MHLSARGVICGLGPYFVCTVTRVIFVFAQGGLCLMVRLSLASYGYGQNLEQKFHLCQVLGVNYFIRSCNRFPVSGSGMVCRLPWALCIFNVLPFVVMVRSVDYSSDGTGSLMDWKSCVLWGACSVVWRLGSKWIQTLVLEPLTILIVFVNLANIHIYCFAICGAQWLGVTGSFSTFGAEGWLVLGAVL